MTVVVAVATGACELDDTHAPYAPKVKQHREVFRLQQVSAGQQGARDVLRQSQELCNDGTTTSDQL